MRRISLIGFRQTGQFRLKLSSANSMNVLAHTSQMHKCPQVTMAVFAVCSKHITQLLRGSNDGEAKSVGDETYRARSIKLKSNTEPETRYFSRHMCCCQTGGTQHQNTYTVGRTWWRVWRNKRRRIIRGLIDNVKSKETRGSGPSWRGGVVLLIRPVIRIRLH